MLNDLSHGLKRLAVPLWDYWFCIKAGGHSIGHNRRVANPAQQKETNKVAKDSEQHAGGISIHAVDIAGGTPAAGLGVKLWHLGNDRVQIAAGSCSESGLLVHPVADGVGVKRGMHEVEFDVGSFYRDRGTPLPNPAFLEVAEFRFGIDRVTEHFHLPFKFTPWGFSLFRGGA